MPFPSTLPIPSEVLKIAKKLEDAGFETWCVGGAIRDNLLGVPNHDFDLTTAAPPPTVQKLFKRTVPVGIDHDTVAVLHPNNQPHEVTTFRKDIHTDGRHAVVEFGVSLMDDLARRDSTNKPHAYLPIRHEWFKGILTAKKVSKLVALWRDVGATRIWLPELGTGSGGEGQGAVDKLPRDPVLVSAYLAKDPASLLIRLKCSNKDIERGRAIGRWRDKYPDAKDPVAIRHWLATTGEHADDLLALLPTASAPLQKAVAAVRAKNPPLSLKDLAVKGADVIAAGVRPGPDVGDALARLLEEVLEDPSRNTKEYLLSRV